MRIGADPWPGSQLQHLLPPQLIQHLNENGFFHLNQIADPVSTNLWHQGWKGIRDLDLPNQWLVDWNKYVNTLHVSHIRLTDSQDELIWELVAHGSYTPKTGYQRLCSRAFPMAPKWWQIGLWKLKCPLMVKIFMWCVLENRIPTWDRMKNRHLEGPGWCPLCKNNEEIPNHLFLSCSFSLQV